MMVLEFKVVGRPRQYAAIDEAIRTTQFIRNKCVRYWQDTPGVKPYDLNRYCAILAQEYAFVRKLNSRPSIHQAQAWRTRLLDEARIPRA